MGCPPLVYLPPPRGLETVGTWIPRLLELPRPLGHDAMKTTYHAKPGELNDRWVHVDAQDQVLGRLASAIAMRLMGKHLPTYTPHVDTGDNVVVTNASGIRVTGRKAEQKVYRHHTGYVGGLVERTYADMMEQKPEQVLELAVRRMLPKSKLGKKLMGKLKVYPGSDHPHGAQQPETISL